MTLAHGNRLRLTFLDGMRGFAALYLVLLHLRQEWDWKFVERGGRLIAEGDPLPDVVRAALKVFDFGHYAVAIFIVISGYCLAMPVARRGDFRLPEGAGPYLLRRARRILPPYYAALALSLLAIAFVPILREPGPHRFRLALPAFEPGVLVSHVLLVHNFSPQWSGKINSPMWSVPPE